VISLNNRTTTAAYTDANTVRQYGTVRVRLQVNNAAIYLLFYTDGYGSGGNPLAESFLLPGAYSFDQVCSGLAVRSANAAAPAQVTATLLLASEVGG
jgi:hypothetical protein